MTVDPFNHADLVCIVGRAAGPRRGEYGTIVMGRRGGSVGSQCDGCPRDALTFIILNVYIMGGGPPSKEGLCFV